MEIPFGKLHENGIDFIVIDEYSRTVIPDDMKAQFATCYCDRRFGIGAEGVLYLSKPEKNDVKMRIFLPDGSEPEMTGDGIRCLARAASDAGYVKDTCTIETPAGPRRVTMENTEEGFFAAVTMTPPKYNREDIPATGSGDYKERIGDYDVFAVNLGVPHAVIIVDSVDAIDIGAVAPAILNHATFPKGANVNFVERTGENSIRIRTFERGAMDETLSCGTGAGASAAMVHRLGLVGETIEVETQGGPVTIFLRDGVVVKGPAVAVFTGIIPF